MPRGQYGLKEWYPHAKDRPKTNGNAEAGGSAEAKEEDDGATTAPKERVQVNVSRNGKHAEDEPIPF